MSSDLVLIEDQRVQISALAGRTDLFDPDRSETALLHEQMLELALGLK